MAHPVDEYVGKRLRERRTLMGMSQEDLAKNVGITFQQVQKYERGANRMSASRLYEFSVILDVPVSFFFDGYAEIGAPGGMQEEGAAFEHGDVVGRESLELMKAYHKISNPKTRRAIGDLVRTIVDGSVVLNMDN